jgi:hypothetical protein
VNFIPFSFLRPHALPGGEFWQFQQSGWAEEVAVNLGAVARVYVTQTGLNVTQDLRERTQFQGRVSSSGSRHPRSQPESE